MRFSFFIAPHFHFLFPQTEPDALFLKPFADKKFRKPIKQTGTNQTLYRSGISNPTISDYKFDYNLFPAQFTINHTPGFLKVSGRIISL